MVLKLENVNNLRSTIGFTCNATIIYTSSQYRVLAIFKISRTPIKKIFTKVISSLHFSQITDNLTGI